MNEDPMQVAHDFSKFLKTLTIHDKIVAVNHTVTHVQLEHGGMIPKVVFTILVTVRKGYYEDNEPSTGEV